MAQQDARAGMPVPDEVWRLGPYLEYWLENVVKRNRRPATYTLYEMNIRLYLIPGLGNQKLTTLSVATVQRFLNERLQKRPWRSPPAPGRGRGHPAAVVMPTRPGACGRPAADLRPWELARLAVSVDQRVVPRVACRAGGHLHPREAGHGGHQGPGRRSLL